MTEIKTIPDGWYTVTTETGCTIYRADGTKLLKEIEAGQGFFRAVENKVFCSDSDAIVRPFKLAPQLLLTLLGQLGGNGGLPAEFMRVAYLQADGNQSIETSVAGNLIDEVSITYEGGTGTMFEAVASVANGLLLYPQANTALRVDYGGVFAATLSVPAGKKLLLFSLEKSQIDINGSVYSVAKKADFTLRASQFWFSTKQKQPAFSYNGKLYEVGIIKGGKKVLWLIPCVNTHTGEPCMYDLVSKKPLYNSGTGAFIAGVENQVQLNNILSKLPDRTGLEVGILQVRLAEALQTPENEAKLDAMLAKNWEISQAA